ncbi:MAG: DUF5719 family protein [Acidimicrobiales bacterium]
MTELRRLMAPIVALVAVVAFGLVIDHAVGSGAARPNAAVEPATPSLAPPGALSSTWFCPALGATVESATRGRIIIGDPGPTDLHVTTTFVPSSGPTVTRTAVVAAFTRMTYKLEEEAPAAFTAATVSIDGSAGAVEQEIQGPLGQSIAPCATESSDRWYFAAGRTDTGSTMLLSLDNPFSTDAIVDLRFVTDQGATSPDAYQGLVVPKAGQIVINVGERVRLRTAVASEVTARAGRLIVDKLQVQQGQGSRSPQGTTPFSGLSVTLGDTAPGLTWYFADGIKAPGVTEHFELYNPADTEAQVQVAAILEQGAAEPFVVTVAPGGRASVQIDQEPRIPASVGQGWVVSAANGVRVVVERVYEELSPAPHTGVADSMGSPRLADRWVFPAGSASEGADEYLIVCNPGPSAANVTVTASGTGQAVVLRGLGPLVLAPRSRQAIRIGDARRAGIVALDVTADRAIVAERSQANVSQPGLSGAIGVASRVPS